MLLRILLFTFLAVLIYLGVVPSALAYAMFFAGIKTVPGAVASIVTLLEPLTATLFALRK